MLLCVAPVTVFLRCVTCVRGMGLSCVTVGCMCVTVAAAGASLATFAAVAGCAGGGGVVCDDYAWPGGCGARGAGGLLRCDAI